MGSSPGEDSVIPCAITVEQAFFPAVAEDLGDRSFWFVAKSAVHLPEEGVGLLLCLCVYRGYGRWWRDEEAGQVQAGGLRDGRGVRDQYPRGGDVEEAAKGNSARAGGVSHIGRRAIWCSDS